MTVWMCSGQGAQSEGMGADLLDILEVREVFLSLDDAFKLLKVRASAMAEACQQREGAMLALLAASHEDAEAVCEACAGKDILLPANFNCPGQVVLSGDAAAIERAEAHWKGMKKKCARLKTAGGFHSPLMTSASEALANYFEGSDAPVFNEAEITLICNTDAAPFVVSEAAERLSAQVISPVLFEQGVNYLIDKGENEFVEIGYGGVLFTMMKRISKEVDRVRVGTREQFDEYVSTL